MQSQAPHHTFTAWSAIAAFAASVDRVTRFACLVLTGIVFAALLGVVVLRYVFGMGFLELQDAASYAFAALVVLGIPVAYRADAHVRVDIFRAGMAPRAARRFDIAAYFLLVIPIFGITLWQVWPDIAYAWSIREGSRETGGLAGYFLVKTMLPLACVLMLFQGLVLVITRSGGDRDGG